MNIDKKIVCQYGKVNTEENKDDCDAEVIPKYGYGVRHIQVLLMFFSMSVGFLARGHLGVSIVAMTYSQKSLKIEDNLSKESNMSSMYNIVKSAESINRSIEELANFNANESLGNNGTIYTVLNEFSSDDNAAASFSSVNRRYDWQSSVREMVLNSFFLGYCIMMFPIGMVCQRWGGKIPLQIALLLNAVVSFLTPWLAMWGGWKVVCFCRILQGLSQAGFFPATHELLAAWVPSSERATYTSYVYAGITFGTVTAFQIGGLFAESRWGWPATFWVIGVICLFGFILLTVFGAATPSEHKTITEAERNYIMGRIDDKPKKKTQVPWKEILTSKHIWATFATHSAAAVSFVFFFTQVPTYMYYILGFNIKDSGFLSSLPYIFSFFSGIIFGQLSDFLTNKKILTIRTARIISNCVSQVGQAICLFLVTLTSSSSLAIVCLITTLTLTSAMNTGFLINYMDLAPNYSGTLMATGNTLANIFVQFLPVLFSNIVTDMTNQSQWRTMFFMMAGVVLTMNAVFVIFMSAEKQPWNDKEDENQGEESTGEKKELKQPE